MKKYTTTVTERGQVTLPASIRQLLGIKPREKVTFEVEGNDVRLVPARFTVESVRGYVPAPAVERSLDEIYEAVGRDFVAQVFNEMNGVEE